MKPAALVFAIGFAFLARSGADQNTVPPPASGKALIELLRQDGKEAKDIAERIRCTQAAMNGLLAANRDTLFAAFDLQVTGKWLPTQQLGQLVRRCTSQDANAVLIRLEAIDDVFLYVDIAIAAWTTIAHNDPERAVAGVQNLYEPANPFHRAALQMRSYFYRVVFSVMREAGSSWWRREGTAATRRLGTLPHAKDLDDPLFRGMCDAATNATERLLLLDWLVSPKGATIDRFEKGSSTRYERTLINAAREDFEKTRAWVERRFPLGTARKSAALEDWDVVHFRMALFEVWSETEPRKAADWLIAQFPDSDPDVAFVKTPSSGGTAQSRWEAFRLEDRPPGLPPTPEDRQLAKRLADLYTLWSESSDPQKRLTGVDALKWFANAGNDECARVLLGHLANTHLKMDPFAVELLNTWADRDGRACERFAWEAGLPNRLRQDILINTFERAAENDPDAALARLKELITSNRLRSNALDPQPPVQTGPGCFWFADRIPSCLGEGWIVKDDIAAIGKMKTLPKGWAAGALKGAAGEFRTAAAGLALLDWLETLDTTEPRQETRCTGFSWHYWLDASTVISRLAEIDFDAAKRWLEANPARVQECGVAFDGFGIICSAYMDRDPLAAAAWARRIRPGFEIAGELVYALAQKDEAAALAWIDAHSGDPDIDDAFRVMANRWEIRRPAEAARFIARMKPSENRTSAAGKLVQTWKRLDSAAATAFLDQTFGKQSQQRKAVETELDRLKGYVRE